jgi:hypothetical protein
MPDLDAKILTELLEAVGAHLEADRDTASIVLVGGAALALRGWVVRTTHDVDVIATGHRCGNVVELVPPDLPTTLHFQDLLALAPTDAELQRAETWVAGQDAGAEFPNHLSEAIAHVRRHREDR